MGVRGKLLLAFLAICAFAVLAASAAIYSFRQVGDRLDIVDTRVRPTLNSLELSRSAERIIAAAPALLAAASRKQQDKLKAELSREVDHLKSKLLELRHDQTDVDSLLNINPVVSSLVANLEALDTLVARRLSANERIRDLQHTVFETNEDIQRLLAPWTMITDRQISMHVGNLKSAGPGERADAPELASLLRLQRVIQAAEQQFSSVIDRLTEASTVGEERRLAILEFQLGKALHDLGMVAQEVDPKLRPLFLEHVAKLASFTQGPDSLTNARRQELALIADAEQRLKENASLSTQLTAAVDQLTGKAKADVEGAIGDALSLQRVSTRVLLVLVGLSLLTSALIVWLYVGRSIVRRLTALSDGMLAIADGRLTADVAVDGSDEIAAMGRAVEVFRRNTMERDELLAQQSEAAERLEGQVATRTAELAHSVEELRALGEVSQAVNSSLDLDRVLDTIVARATQLSSTEAGAIYVFDETAQEFRLRATCGMDATIVTEITDTRIRLGETAIGEAALRRKPLQIPDVRSDPTSLVLDVIVRAGFRALLIVPLIGSDRIVGALVVRRRQPGSFPDRTVELLETFATQSVLAIQNARLFEALEVRTRELQEAFDHQTATSEVLNVISRSPAELQPVLDVIIETAVRLCEADSGTIARLRDGQFFRSGQFGFSHEFAELMTRAPVEMTRGTITGRALLEGKVVHVLDAAEDPEYTWTEALKLASIRTGLGVPLMRDGVPIGVIALTRRTVRAFTDKQIELVTTFADQAVIAIENVRLFEEVQSRTAELARSVSELRALGEVSQAVNSTLDIKTVLETIVAKAVQLSDTNAGTIYVYSKSADRFRLRATYGMSTELITALSGQTMALDEGGIGDAARQRQPVQIADLSEGNPSAAQKILLDAGFRAVLVVPLLRQRSIVGALVVRRRRPGIFSNSVVRLLETFAAQSVLAIQNARLFSEIEEKGRQLEIASRHKSQFLANMSHELRTPLNSVLGFTEMLVDGLYGDLPDKAKATLNRVQVNGRHLLGLINDVLDLSKIEAGQLALAIDDYSIGQIVKTVAATTEPLARAKGLDMNVNIANGLPLGRGDERRLSQVLINLVGNAVKFTEHGSIEIAAKDVNGFFEVLVRDTGPGIAPEHQSRIFEEFQQVDESSTRRKGGTGLGLAISKRIIELHGGSIELDSTLGRGSTFRVAVPIRADQGIAAA